MTDDFSRSPALGGQSETTGREPGLASEWAKWHRLTDPLSLADLPNNGSELIESLIHEWRIKLAEAFAIPPELFED